MINVTSAFSMGISGGMSEHAAGIYNKFMGNMFEKYQGLSGWLSGAVDSAIQAHDTFMNSRMWEFSKRIGNDGHFVGRFEVGYLSEARYQQQATGFMRNFILANPEMWALHEAERISAYGGDFSDRCSGLRAENYYYNKAMDGLAHLQEDEMHRTQFWSSVDDYTHLSAMERINVQRTWNASNIHIAKNLFDPTSITGENILSIEDVEARRKAVEEEESGDNQ